MLNADLKIGDKVRLLHMEDETMIPGLIGTVTGVTKDPFESEGKIISVNWENGSTLSLLSSTDAWMKIEENKKINESRDEFFISNLDLVKNFNTKFLVDYLLKIRDSGITNMFGAAPYLYMGRERIEHEFKYEDFNNSEQEQILQEVLDLADEAQSVMIQGVIKTLESQNKDLSVENINNGLRRYSSRIVEWYINVMS